LLCVSLSRNALVSLSKTRKCNKTVRDYVKREEKNYLYGLCFDNSLMAK